MTSSATASRQPDSLSAGDKLRIALQRNAPMLQGKENLLLGFHFGASVNDVPMPGLVDAGLDPVGDEDLYECWWYDGPVDHVELGNTRIARCDDYAAVVLQVPDAQPAEFRSLTYDVYKELIAAVSKTGHGRIVRMWNYFGDINQGEGDNEKYRQFSIGRAEAFEESGVTDTLVPAATAIGGARDCDFTVVALVSRHDFHNFENPRQISAFAYPRDYGPRSPKFSRAGCVSAGDDRLLLISGTAAIIGHESMHAGDVAAQCEETLNNLRKLCETISETEGLGVSAVLDKDAVVRVYIRNPEDHEFVSRQVEEFLGGHSDTVAILHAEVCRHELQLEIEAARIAAI